MIRVEALDEVNRQVWDRQTLAHPGASLNQTTTYADYVCRSRGSRRPLFVRCSSGERVLARLLCFVDSTRQELTWRQGPLLIGEEPDVRRACAEVAAWVSDLGVDIGAATTPVFSGWRDSAQVAILCTELTAVGATCSLAGRFHVPLDEHFLSRLDRGVRRNVRRCAERGISITTSIDLLEDGWLLSDVEAAYAELIEETLCRNGVNDQDPEAAASVILSQDLEHRSLTFFGLDGARPLAALNVVVTGGTASERKQAYSDVCRRRRLHVNDAVKVAAFEWAHGAGMSTFDLMGVRLTSSSPTTGIARYKSKFGGIFRPCLEFRGGRTASSV